MSIHYCQACGRTLQVFSVTHPGPYCVCGSPGSSRPVTSMMTPEDSKRVAEAILGSIYNMEGRFNVMCINIEQSVHKAASNR